MISDDGSSGDAVNDFHLIAAPLLLESVGDEEDERGTVSEKKRGRK